MFKKSLNTDTGELSLDTTAFNLSARVRTLETNLTLYLTNLTNVEKKNNNILGTIQQQNNATLNSFGEVRSDISRIDTTINNVKSDIIASNTNIQSVQSDVLDMSSRVDSTVTSINGLTNELNIVKDSVADAGDLPDRVANIVNSINLINNDITAIKAGIVRIDAASVTTNNRITTTNTNVTNNYNTLNTKTNTTNTTVANNKTLVSNWSVLVARHINNFARLDLSLVGLICASVLTEGQMNANSHNNYVNPSATMWYLCDGRSCSGTTYAAISGRSTVPDLRGLFLRGNDPSKLRNPDVSSLENIQGWALTQIKSETGAISETYANSHPGYSSDVLYRHNRFPASHTPRNIDSSTCGSLGFDTIRCFPNNTSSETRPINMSVHYYIKVNSLTTSLASI